MKNVTYISAGAGSGKTYTLTTKLAELVAKDKNDPEHVEPEQVILTTFTVKAANEFKEKAKAELYKIGKYDEASRLDHALMGTIDSVATEILVHHRSLAQAGRDGRQCQGNVHQPEHRKHPHR